MSRSRSWVSAVRDSFVTTVADRHNGGSQLSPQGVWDPGELLPWLPCTLALEVPGRGVHGGIAAEAVGRLPASGLLFIRVRIYRSR